MEYSPGQDTRECTKGENGDQEEDTFTKGPESLKTDDIHERGRLINESMLHPCL